MTRDDVLKGLKEKFGEDIIEVIDKSPKRLYVEINPASVIRIAKYVFRDLGARFSIASGVDVRQHFEILYHFIIEEINLMVSLRVKLSHENPEIDSLAPIFEGANWIEREIYEMLGIKFTGHPNLKKLLLPDEWPEGVYPLRTDYKEWDGKAVRDRGV